MGDEAVSEEPKPQPKPKPKAGGTDWAGALGGIDRPRFGLVAPAVVSVVSIYSQQSLHGKHATDDAPLADSKLKITQGPFRTS